MFDFNAVALFIMSLLLFLCGDIQFGSAKRGGRHLYPMIPALAQIDSVIGYGLKEPEFIDLETALRVNIYRNKEETAESCSTAQKSGSIAEKSEDENSTIEHKIRESLLSKGLTEKYIDNILIVYSSVNNQVFKQSDIMSILKCSKTKAGYLISSMKKTEIIVSVQAGVYGGYRFAI